MKKYLKEKLREFLIPQEKLVVLTYHQASPQFDKKLNGQYIWTPIDFLERQLDFLKNNYQITGLMDGVSKLRKGELKETAVAITFDDGDISVQKYIIPLLERMKLPATFFINTAYLNNLKPGYWFNIFSHIQADNDLSSKYLSRELKEIASTLRNTNDQEYYRNKYMIIEKLGDLLKDKIQFYISENFLEGIDPELFTIGLHGHEHQRFSMMTKEWQRSNLLENINRLSRFKAYKPVFAIPFGKERDWNVDTLEICRQLKLEYTYSNGGYNTKNMTGIKRIPADGMEIKKIMNNLKPEQKWAQKLTR